MSEGTRNEEGYTMTASDHPTTKVLSPSPDGPYSIFDKRQKAVIVVIVSIAATCEYTVTQV